jgi:hypothetical protein
MPELEQLRGIARATLRVFQDPPPRVDYSDRRASYEDVDGEAERV